LKGFSHPYPFYTPSPIDRDHLQPPDILVETYEDDLDKLLKPCFDSLWNAIGISSSPNYDEEGNWHIGSL